MSGIDDADAPRRDYKPSHNARHPIPTISRYQDEKHQRQVDASDKETNKSQGQKATEKVADAAKTLRYGADQPGRGSSHLDVYDSRNKNVDEPESPAEITSDEGMVEEARDASHDELRQDDPSQQTSEKGEESQTFMENLDPRAKRKQMKNRKAERAEREVTDPVTHLPVKIHDFTGSDLKVAPQNEPSPREDDANDNDRSESHSAMESLFPPPQFDLARDGLVKVLQQALTFGVASLLLLSTVTLAFFVRKSTWFQLGSSIILLLGYVLLGVTAIWGLCGWLDNKVKDVWENHVWEAERQRGQKLIEDPAPESTQWLNSLFASVWPLVNPDLFTSLADTLEDVMQASLPKFVRMVSVDDIGQGTEALRILGVRWLPLGNASQSVSKDGVPKPKQGEEDQDQAKESTNSGQSKDDGNNEVSVEGLEAEEGDFLNLEIAFAYRARAEAKGLRKRAKNMHLYLGFFLPSRIKFPVWVELRGLVGAMRLRLQLTPDPPFFSLCTMTFLGQPKVEISCAPLSRHGLDIMDLPVISNFVQSSVDAAMAEYVAPKSLMLDLKDMLVGDDFKKDTNAKGVLMVRIKRAYGIKEGDVGVTMLRKGSSDPYVTVGWAKFGKPLWATRVIETEMEPSWDECGYILVSPQELNVDERLRVQLWDSDRTTADDQLGHVDLDLKGIMRNSESNNRMQDREDGLSSIKAGDTMPGTLEWSVGYFPKTRLLKSQIEQQGQEPDINSQEELKEKVFEESEQKLREAKFDESKEIDQQKRQDLKSREDQLIISAPPSKDYPSGLLSIQIHQIIGLELETIRKKATGSDDGASSDEESEDLPSGYCTIILNHRSTFKTRTKPKNAKPFFNAGCERFIRDWQSSEVHVAVRDSRVHEEDALIGVVHLPLDIVFEERSQVDRFFPISGGVGYGRVRISMVFRSIKLQAPPPVLGWEYGTLEIQPEIVGKNLSHELQQERLKLRTTLGRGKLQADGNGSWKVKGGEPLRLAVRKRHSTYLLVEFRNSRFGRDDTEAFAILWLQDISDEVNETVNLPVWKGNLERARKNCLQSYGEKVGEVEVHLKFWRGLSAYHYGLASKDPSVANVMDVLDATNDNDEVEREVDEGKADTDSSSSSSSDEDDGDELGEDGKRGPKRQLKEYKENKRQLHRRNRGIMQWKGARTVPWLSHKIEHSEQRFHNLFHHRERDAGVETEV